MNYTTHKLRVPSSDKVFDVRVAAMDESVTEALSALNGAYEPWVLAILQRYLRKDAVCLDIGANIGIMSLAMSVLAPQGQIYAFEASKQNYELLRDNLAINRVTNVEPLHLAVYDREGEVVFEHVNEFAAGSYISETTVHDHRAQVDRVRCVRLSDWLTARNDIRKVDLVKMDIEGAEIRALHGAKEMLGKNKPYLLIECNDHTLRTFQGQSPAALYDVLAKIFPYVYLIGRSDAALNPIRSHSDFHTLIVEPKAEIEDLFCSFEPLTTESKTWKLPFWRK